MSSKQARCELLYLEENADKTDVRVNVYSLKLTQALWEEIEAVKTVFDVATKVWRRTKPNSRFCHKVALERRAGRKILQSVRPTNTARSYYYRTRGMLTIPHYWHINALLCAFGVGLESVRNFFFCFTKIINDQNAR